MGRKMIFFLCSLVLFSCKPEKNIYETIVPHPLSIKLFRGSFMFNDHMVIVWDPRVNGSEKTARYLSDRIKDVLKWNIRVKKDAGKRDYNYIGLSLLSSANDLGREGYVLEVNSDSVMIYANEAPGLFYGIQSLLQVIVMNKKTLMETGLLELPCVSVKDKPRFAWRGMHLDVARHFFNKAFIKKYLDVMAFHKLNVFHWHLTDDQGWRIEIKKYPRLTEVGAWRKDNGNREWNYVVEPAEEGKPRYGGFYTQEEIREIVNYAAERHITVVPEIEMPGHSWMALYVFPELSCTGKPWKKPDTVAFEFTDPFCAGNEKTFEFIENVLSEVIDLFHSPYIHIGGDECRKTPWEKCKKCQKRMQEEGLTKVEELQSYFIRRVEKFVNSKGRQIIGWDEILEGGIAPGAAVMSWRGEEGGIEAARQGHHVVMVPSRYLYFKSAYQYDPSTVPLRETYDYDPVPAVLTDKEKQYIMGVQGCLWTETVYSDSIAMEKLLPRLAALAEISWLPAEQKDFSRFISCLPFHYQRFDAMNWNYYLHVPSGVEDDIFYTDRYLITLSSEIPGTEIRYTLDGSEPVLNSTLYTGPVEITENALLQARAFLKNGKGSMVRTAVYKKVALKEPVNPPALRQGLHLTVRKGNIQRLDQLTSLPVTGQGNISGFLIPDSLQGDYFAMQFEGFIKIKKNGVYTFYLRSDDGSRLFIDDDEVVNYDGVHGAGEVSGKIALKAGYHAIRVDYFEARYGQILEVKWKDKKDGDKEPVPASILYCVR